jgi:hypothetical protein
LALQPAVGFGLSNNTSAFFPIYHQLSPSPHSQHMKISFYFSPSFPGSSSSSRPFQLLSEDLFGHPILLHSLQVTSQLILCRFIYFTLLSTYIHTNNTENDANQTIHRTTQKYLEQNEKYIEHHKS